MEFPTKSPLFFGCLACCFLLPLPFAGNFKTFKSHRNNFLSFIFCRNFKICSLNRNDTSVLYINRSMIVLLRCFYIIITLNLHIFYDKVQYFSIVVLSKFSSKSETNEILISYVKNT